MRSSIRMLLVTTASLTLPLAAHAKNARDAEENPPQSRDITVTGVAESESFAVTGLPLSLRETPQSVTTINRERIDDFALNNVNDLLDQAVGVTVERAETDRVEYTSRGFDITNFQVDGIGLPLLFSIQYGDLDTTLFDQVQVVRGANALMTGVGNPSATINYVRKRPTDDFHLSLSGQIGSWDDRRVDADVNVPLDSQGKVAARLIYAHEKQDSYLDYRKTDREVYGALLSWKITPELKATAGYSRQENNVEGNLWGALPLLYTDGTRIDYPSSASTSAPWTYWNHTTQSAFAELAYTLPGGWSARGVFTYNHKDREGVLLYAYGYPDRETHQGIAGMAGRYPDTEDQYIGDLYASGPFTLFGREHELSFGFSTARRDYTEAEAFSSDAITYPGIPGLDDFTIAEPGFPEATPQADTTDKLTRLYGAAHLNFTDRLKAVVGASAMWLTTSGESYGVDAGRDASKVSPYAGLVFDLTRHISLYGSYTNIFNPQSEVDINRQRLDPAKGSSIEGGVKTEWLNGHLYATAALFRAKQKGLAEYAGILDNGDSYYTGVDTTSKGFEVEVAGRITDNWTLSGGYTGLDIEDQNGADTRTYLPTKSFKLASTYTVPDLRNFQIGAQMRWQNDITSTDSSVQAYGGVDGDVVIRQKGYAIVDMTAAIDVVDHVRARVNVRNVTDHKYLNSLIWGQAFYAAPRSVLFSLEVNY
ncbi:TonB-dependent siderophore receptor [Stakelama sp. CBK3Z-3]|uniref:TonB-dependent siderophore receptor n=1 Tax=Stakelama flava TaxID=2860338 RepID=A0ABS6XPN4_9SPHN|nr:TonB-dependent siderophore receptor [Stakelama flava]MBW4332184.1 TonB-dependent siderophore receptor [Stakelama flava]